MVMQTILIVDDDRTANEAVAEVLREAGRELVLCGDIESAELVLERSLPALVVTDLRLSGPFCYEGLDLIGYVKRYAPDCQVVVVARALAQGLAQEALRRGADAVFSKPFCLDALRLLLPASRDTTEPSRVVRIPSIDEVLKGHLLIPSYQPIVDLATKGCAVHGFESLARYRGAFLSDPSALFEYAARKSRLVDLEPVCMPASFA